jgi:hypothetical protein
MAYLNCGRCGLEIKVQATLLRIENCPRCLARGASVAPMTLSSSGVRRTAGWGAGTDDVSDPRGLAEPFALPLVRADERRHVSDEDPSALPPPIDGPFVGTGRTDARRAATRRRADQAALAAAVRALRARDRSRHA